MTARKNPFTSNFGLIQPFIDFAHATKDGVDPTLGNLIEIRASQINGCAGCLVMHTRAARSIGESEERIYLLNAWRESTLFSERERAALAWTEAVTTLQPGGVPDDVYETFAATFDAKEQALITLLVGVINVFNRMNVSYQVRPPASPARNEA